MRHGFVKVAAASPRVIVGDTVCNAESVIAVIKTARAAGVKILVLPELCLTGATCGDLFFQETLLAGALHALKMVCEATRESDMMVFAGLPVGSRGRVYNCAAIVQNGEVVSLVPQKKPAMTRYFSRGTNCDMILSGVRYAAIRQKAVVSFKELTSLSVGVEFGSDLWMLNPPSLRHAELGATVIVNLAAEPETALSAKRRLSQISSHSYKAKCAYIYAGAGEGESTTDRVYAGHCIIAENGEILAAHESGIVICEIDVKQIEHERQHSNFLLRHKGHSAAGYMNLAQSIDLTDTVLTRHIPQSPFIPEAVYERPQYFERTLKLQSLGLVQRLRHTRAETAVLGLSGGLDSTLAALVTARALDQIGLDRKKMLAVTMPCFGTTPRTRSNAELLAGALGAQFREVDISESVKQHFIDIGHDINVHDVVFENAQARERTQVLMDVANACNGMVIGTGDMSEIALGWTTFNGDHMSMYGVNASIPKTLVRALVEHCAASSQDAELAKVLESILDTPVSPELLPAKDGEISQKTEDIVGPYELHDFFLYYALQRGCEPEKIQRLAAHAFTGKYEADTIRHWLTIFFRRFFSQQFKRSTMPDGPAVTELTLSPRGGLVMPSDASSRLWMENIAVSTDADKL